MKRILILTALAVMPLSMSGCAHDPCRPGLFHRWFHKDGGGCCESTSNYDGGEMASGGCGCSGGGMSASNDVIIGPPTTIVPAPAR